MTVRLFVDAALRANGEIELPRSAARHVQVRRMQPGETLRLFDGHGGEWAAHIVRIGRSDVTVCVERHDPVERELGVRVSVAVGMPANDRMDLLVEKATELGVHSIQPLLCERSVLRLDGERSERRREHWRAVAAAASEQSGRTRVPQIGTVQRLDDWLAGPAAGAGQRLLLSLRDAAKALSALPGQAADVLTLSGPEGGLSAAEEDAAIARGFVATRLGARVLRAETAPLAVLAYLGLR
jgi:16S rRNA (uracil1498-N3)-methyltransferase